MDIDDHPAARRTVQAMELELLGVVGAVGRSGCGECRSKDGHDDETEEMAHLPSSRRNRLTG